ncbi:hypothetical protein U9869_27485, partial [Escherichia coli]
PAPPPGLLQMCNYPERLIEYNHLSISLCPPDIFSIALSPPLTPKGCCNAGNQYLNRENRNQHLLFKTPHAAEFFAFMTSLSAAIFSKLFYLLG